ncbi:1-acyl-sn-glycerol-3-phosphate acyltransferase [Arcticibacter svalbardensis MN12-7]|uniref:1-acyl-sn-glycerol-3-phosphate acyltransferase n=1 Tax=Arcticibacter svalbardensis MN12-7 TaxID=1150600 RepID=R9GVW3_9SPHI|nr:lysophospholipid acyltransferase family protein [Arcticibacter svalbardensis]EOR95640.1 1-acyl-sn-glycerol-3-phosphate acyltransferase [Arcticibacter svalbardensis MN12-7]
MKRLLKRSHRYLYFINVFFYFTLLYPFLYYFSRKRERYPTLNKWRRLFSYLATLSSGFRYKYHFETPIDWSQSYIICANHSSNLDIPAMAILVKGNYAFMAKEELLHNPVTGLFLETIDIPLNRNSKMSSFRAFKRAETYLKSNISVIVFPEGGISEHYPPQLGEFKNGPFRLAIEYNLAIIPVSIPDNYKNMWDDGSKYGSRPGICHICVHAPVLTQGLTSLDADDLKVKVFNLINSGLL